MNLDPNPPRTTQRDGPRYRPVALLGLLYFALLFLGFGLLLVVPELVQVFEEIAPGPEQQAAAQQAVHEVFRPRLPIALVMALAATAVGTHFKLLPGFRG
ncbi:MAG: hypothetical protein IH881_03495 [Myxococcales bacterium]|nr:hypothetical protein [Myxococcales bacterium]MCH7866734.1 hypothetical protein [Myxococcales bacterium]